MDALETHTKIFREACSNARGALSTSAAEQVKYEHVPVRHEKCSLEVTGATLPAYDASIYFVGPGDLEEGGSIPDILKHIRENGIKFDADKAGEMLCLFGALGPSPSATLLVSMGKAPDGTSEIPPLTRQSFNEIMTSVVEEIEKRKWKKVRVGLPPEREPFSSAETMAAALRTASYKFDILKGEKHKPKKADQGSGDGEGDQPTTVHLENLKGDTDVSMIKTGVGLATGQNYARTLKNLPANLCSTDYMKHEMQALLDLSPKFSDFVCLTESEMAKSGMGCFTAVGVGSKMPSYLCKIEWNKPKADCKEGAKPPVVLLGKGVVHDSGGLNIKLNYMVAMKMDMGGAASVMGALRALVELDLDLHVVGVIGLVENSVSGGAYRPGDVLKSMNGLTVEVGNTDAEGRLVLCDCLTWIERTYAAGPPDGGDAKVEDSQKPTVIDIATLTGACLVALGGELSGGYSNTPELLEQLEQAGKKSQDRIWKMPLLEVEQEYTKLLKSEVADLNNIGGSAGGSITAALFLSKFAKKLRWAHLDVAATAMGGSFDKAKATGRPVPVLTQFLRDMAAR